MKNNNCNVAPPIGKGTMTTAIGNADRYTEWIVSKFRPYIGKTLLEVGVGHGNYCQFFPNTDEYIGVDVDKQVISALQNKHKEYTYICSDISSTHFNQQFSSLSVDSIICVNVLEHIQLHQNAAMNLSRLLSPGGFLCVLVPAHTFLYSDMDTLAGHERRYTKNSLARLFDFPELEVILLEYFNPVGGMGWLLNKFISHNNLDSNNLNSQVRFFDRFCVGPSRILNAVSKSFFGQSVIGVFKKCSQ